ncbi:MAG: GatB/YqeY domain-containing protein [Lentimicrobiaceae bacterium]|nr:GatB/YqeY domain-containing protein [Lentimicrobiaceae bacterium]
MKLEELINNDMKECMLNKDMRKLEALRAIKAALLLEKTGKDVNFAEVPETLEIQLLQRLVKQRRESAAIYIEQNREDLAEEEIYQAGIIEKYLPEQLSEEEVQEIVKQVIEEVGATSMKDMGKVMGIVTKKIAGKADNKMISNIVKSLLS